MRDISRFNEKQRQVLEKLRSGSAGAKYFHDVIVLLLDVSNSMAGEKIREARVHSRVCLPCRPSDKRGCPRSVLRRSHRPDA
jgi:hypothetical protein